MPDIAALLDQMNTANGVAWSDAFDALLEAGYSWQYSSADDYFRLNDLLAYFGF